MVNTDDLTCGKASMRATLLRLLAFLQLDTEVYPWDSIKASTFSNPMKAYSRHGVPPAEEAKLGALYAPHNEWLHRLSGKNVGADTCDAARERAAQGSSPSR